MATDDTSKTGLADEFVDAGWADWDLPDAFGRIQDALDYMDEHDSI